MLNKKKCAKDKSALLNLFFMAISFILLSCTKSVTESNEELLKHAIDSAANKADWKKARSLSYEAAKRNPLDVNAHVMLAISLEQSGQIDTALTEVRKAVEIDPKHFMAQYTMGRMLFDSERFADCVGPLTSANKLQPGNANVLLFLARCSTILDLTQNAIKYYTSLAKHPDFKNKPDPYNELGVIFAGKKDWQRAARCFSEAYKRAPDNHIVVLNLAVFCDYYLKNFQKAAAFYQKYQRLTSHNPALEPKRVRIKERIERIRVSSAGT